MSAGPSTSATQALQNVANAAEEFVDKMNPTQEDLGEAEAEGEEGNAGAEGADSTLEAKRKKLEELRKRMVSSHPFEHWRSRSTLFSLALRRGLLHKPTARQL